MIDFLRFWLILQIFGLLALPLAWRLFASLPDRGYTFARPLGLLGAGYLLWLGASFGLLRNTSGGVVLSMLLFAGLGLWLGRAGLQRDAAGNRPLLAHLRAQRRTILVVEVIFLLALGGWTVFRAYNPEIAGTEKPMEFAFLNGILNSSQFPPRDPWLAGYGISYYYFGYVLLNALVLLTGVAPSVAFNLGLAAIFALTVVGAFGVVFNLVAGGVDATGGSPVRERAAGKGLLYGGLGAVLVAIMGNLEGVLEVLHARGLMSPALHAFFDIKELQNAPVTGAWNPGSGHWWWWRAARTLHDYNFDGTFSQEVIDEFPSFSFILGDMHPHVLALPFVLLAIGLIVNLFRRPQVEAEQVPGQDWRQSWLTVKAVFGADGWSLPVYGLALGALGFLNTWDFPIYVFLAALAYGLRRGLNGAPLDRRLWMELALTLASLTAIGFAGYLPFYLSFSSQASGILPNFYNPTRFAQYFLMFGPFLAALAFLLAAVGRNLWQGGDEGAQGDDVGLQGGRAGLQGGRRPPLRGWLLAVLLLPVLFLAVALLAAGLAPGLRLVMEQALGRSAAEAIPRILSLRASTPATWLVVGALLAVVGAFLSRAWANARTGSPLRTASPADGEEEGPQRTLFLVLAMFFTALLLTYGVEFVYLRDTFGTRMNTVFKFYYQAWILMALGSAYALYYINLRAASGLRRAAQAALALLVLGGMIYPAFAIPSKANNFRGQPTLDGAHFVQIFRPDEAAVIEWLRHNSAPAAVIVEASGGSYSDFNTISAHTGRSTLLGWGGHQLQWRGSYTIPGQREPVIETVYRNQEPDLIRQAVQTLGIEYLIVGPRERDKYRIPANRLPAFETLWEPVFTAGDYSIYRWRGGQVSVSSNQ